MKSIFKTNQNKIVIGQTPNAPLIVWFISLVILYLPVTLPIKLFGTIELISFGAIFTWAWLEIFDGVNVWRRVLGSMAMIVIIVTRI